MIEQRLVMMDNNGEPAVSYMEREHAGRPWADRLKIVGPNAIDVVLERMSGWIVMSTMEVAEQLIARGAHLRRHSHRMSCDLVTNQPPETWLELRPPPPLCLVPCDRPVEDLLVAWRAAYAPGHPDHRTEDDTTVLRDRLAPLLDGRLHGPVLPVSSLVIDRDDQVVAVAVLNLVDGGPPWGGPWLTELFRSPGHRYTGLGTMLLRRTMAHLARDGYAALSLAVTNGNCVRHLYERHGFRTVDSPVSVLVP
jgi:GNAT superfamily N-acetyltransferase